MNRTYPFEALPLPFAYDSLEPYISTDTLYFHHNKHYHTYVDNLNKALEKHSELQDKTLEQLLRLGAEKQDAYELVIRNAGGVYLIILETGAFAFSQRSTVNSDIFIILKTYLPIIFAIVRRYVF